MMYSLLSEGQHQANHRAIPVRETPKFGLVANQYILESSTIFVALIGLNTRAKGNIPGFYQSGCISL
jgi:hypothetical protein